MSDARAFGFTIPLSRVGPVHDPVYLLARADVKAELMRWVVLLGLKEKDLDLARGLDRNGVPLARISVETRRNRVSAMGPADPDAPPLTPAYAVSRTRLLLEGKAVGDRAHFWWGYDPNTGGPWGRILNFHRLGIGARRVKRDVIGISDAALARVKTGVMARWARWKASGLAPRSASSLDTTADRFQGSAARNAAAAGPNRSTAFGSRRPGEGRTAYGGPLNPGTGAGPQAPPSSPGGPSGPGPGRGPTPTTRPRPRAPSTAVNRIAAATTTRPRPTTVAPTPKFGRSKAAVVFEPGERKQIMALAKKAFGRSVTPAELATLAGAPDDARVHPVVRTVSESRVYLSWHSGAASGERLIVRSPKGPVIENEWFAVEPSLRGRGIGRAVFGRQVDEAVRLGVVKIRTMAVRAFDPAGKTIRNGYYTWPRFGYDGPIPKPAIDDLPATLASAKRLSDLMATEEGRTWWLKNGFSVHLEFDPTAGSKSLEIWRDYLRETAARKPTSHPKTSP